MAANSPEASTTTTMRALHYWKWGTGPDVCAVGDVPTPVPLAARILNREQHEQSSSASTEFDDKSDLSVSVPRGMLLLRVHASSLNPVDWKLRSGNRRALLSFKWPRIFGFDVCGEVIGKGEGSTHLLGSHVFGMVRGVESGACAEYMLIEDSLVVSKPDHIDCSDAAAIPLVGITCVLAFELAGLKPRLGGKESAELVKEDRKHKKRSHKTNVDADAAVGPRVLILGGAGGVGTVAIQLAKNVYGASYVACTASAGEKEDLVKSLGADRVVYYRTQQFEVVLADEEPFDFVLVCSDDDPARCARLLRHDPPATVVGLGEPATVECLRAWLERAKPDGTTFGVQGFLRSGIGGALTNTFAGASSIRKKLKPARYESVIGTGDGEAMHILASAMASGQLRAVIDREYSLEEGMEALAHLESGRSKGKVVIRIEKRKEVDSE